MVGVNALRLILFLLGSVPVPAVAASCANPDALGTARVLAVDPSSPPVGRKQFAQTLPLGPKEVVLTFDDGPWPGPTTRVLSALAHECVQATFFLLGRNAAAHPALARRIRAEGHSVGSHTYSHRALSHMAPAAAEAEIDRGIAAVKTALHGTAGGAPLMRFFRFPGFASTPNLLARLKKRGITVFGADLWASDWNAMTPAQELRLVLARLQAAGGGIVLFHDTKAQTAAMLPAFLRALKRQGFRVVHVVPGVM
jgi:peptidoglycan/xylan/chitin deacetylase (PgdA/CDA1 family)